MSPNETARAGFKAYLKALDKTKAELLAMASAIEGGIEETIITSLGSEGASTSAQLSALSKTDRLAVVMEVWQEGNGARSLGSFANFAGITSPV